MTFNNISTTELERMFPGDSEMARRMRAFDWSKSGVGSPETWPQNLRIAIGICLSSRFPMHVWWGPSLTLFYNDAYISFLGRVKHPGVLGRSGQEAWPELWDTIGPMIHEVFTAGSASWSEDILMFFDRELPKEEVYVTFSFSPVFGESNKVEGMFCACTETTEKIIGNRRLDTLRKLSIQTTEACTESEACITGMGVVGENPYDIPFAAIYLVNESTEKAYLVTSTGLTENGHQLPQSVSFAGEEEDHLSPWPLATVLRTKNPIEITVLDALGIKQLGKPWPDPVRQAIIFPIHSAGHEKLAGLLIVGVSPRLPLNEAYRTFFGLVAGHIANAIADARSYEEERKRAEALLELDRAKTAFFSNVSHEFRTPLTLILGPLEDELRENPDAGQRLEIVYRNSIRLLKLVNTLLDFSRIEAGRMEAVFEPTDLSAYTAELASTFRSAIEKAGMHLNVNCSPLPDLIYIDKVMWEKIVLNLLSNAFKFTFKGEIAVSLRWLGDHTELDVKDTGTGIAPEEMPRLFERFHRIRGAQARTHEGTGIGLALVQELVKQHGGDIKAVSTPGKGTTFTVSIPAGFTHLPKDRIGAARTLISTTTGAASFIEEALRWLPDEEAVNQNYLSAHENVQQPIAVTSHEERARVLLADDNADMRSYIRRLLSDHYEVETVGDGNTALAAVKTNPPDLVLTDIMMPGLDGLDLLHHLRTGQDTKSIPVILLSARAGEESRIEGLDLGADDYIVKPFSARELVAKIGAQIGMARIRRDAFQREQQLLRNDHRKNEFISTLSHELRNPLAAISAGLQLLDVTQDGVQAGKAKEIIKRQMNQLCHLVDDLLDITRIANNKIVLKKEKVEINILALSVADDQKPLFEEKRVRLITQTNNELLYLDADPVRLRQIIGNLLHNALKFSYNGGKTVLSVYKERNEAVICVTDNGIGIKPDILTKLFEPFMQLDTSLDRKNGGLGLGLSITKGIAELHGGYVEASSEGLGKGASFYIHLPLIQSECEDVENNYSTKEFTRSLKILLIDDNRDFVDLLCTMLGLLGHQMFIAFNGIEGIKKAKEVAPDVLICDIGLPDMSGYDVANILRKENETKEIFMIAMTGYAQPQDITSAIEAGFKRHIAKPVDMASVKEILNGI
jgi:signal transduction histidine kinase